MRILIVEDDPALAVFLQKGLILEGHEVDRAGDGDAALEMAAQQEHAQFRIRGAILDSLRVLDWSPRELRRKGRAVQEAIQTMTCNLRRTPTETEIASELNLGIHEYQLLLGQLKGLEIGSLNVEHNDDSGEDQLAYIAGSPEDDPLFRCLQGEIRQLLVDAIEELPEKERMVLTLYYYEELTMKEIALTLGVVESRISQIHSSAVVRLRTSLAGLRADHSDEAKSSGGKKKVAVRMVA